MSRILADLSQPPQPRRFASAMVITHHGEFPQQTQPEFQLMPDRKDHVRTGQTNQFGLQAQAVRGYTSEPSARISNPHQRLRPLHRNKRALYRPRDMNPAAPLFSIFDRETGFALAQVRGHRDHVLAEANKLAVSQGGTLADLLIKIES